MDLGRLEALGGAPPELVRLFHLVHAQKDRQLRELVTRTSAKEKSWIARTRDKAGLAESEDRPEVQKK